jgi:acyl-CoA oxidase
MPLLAVNYIYFFGGLNILKQFDDKFQQLLDPKNIYIEELHAISGVTKAKSSWLISEVITQCRELVGGHGYSAFNRMGKLYHDQDLNSTWEGDNNMLLQQTTKYLLKSVSKVKAKKNINSNRLSFFN